MTTKPITDDPHPMRGRGLFSFLRWLEPLTTAWRRRRMVCGQPREAFEPNARPNGRGASSPA